MMFLKLFCIVYLMKRKHLIYFNKYSVLQYTMPAFLLWKSTSTFSPTSAWIVHITWSTKTVISVEKLGISLIFESSVESIVIYITSMKNTHSCSVLTDFSFCLRFLNDKAKKLVAVMWLIKLLLCSSHLQQGNMIFLASSWCLLYLMSSEWTSLLLVVFLCLVQVPAYMGSVQSPETFDAAITRRGLECPSPQLHPFCYLNYIATLL